MLFSRPARATLIGFFAWALAVVLSLRFGAIVDADTMIIAQLRLPRALLASAVGAGLAVSGATLQALFTNPLAEPYTLGISSGSALGAVIGAALGMQWMVAGLAGTAFLGAILFLAVLYLVARRPSTSTLTLLLTGVMLGFLGSSLVALWMAMADANGIQGALSWLLGDLSRARLNGAIFALAASAILTVVIWMHSGELDALLMGEENALTVGVAVSALRTRLILASALMIAVSVSAAGMIGFIGLVVPHFARRWVGSLHWRLIPLCALWGAATLTLADCLARLIASPYELPVGVVTALLGAPVFLWVMLNQKERA